MARKRVKSGAVGAAKKKMKVEDPPVADEEVEEVEETVEEEQAGFQVAPVDTTVNTESYTGAYVNKQRVLIFSSRGVTSRARHLMEDLRQLLPHHKKEVKLDAKDNLRTVNEIAEIKGCNSTLFFEARKRSDLYLWASHTPHGPSAKFLVSNIHTMDELRLTGNCMQGSRPILSFDQAFDTLDHLKVVKAMFTNMFGTPRGHPKSKPFIDRIMSFYYVDNRVWVRNYQIMDTGDGSKKLEAAAQRSGDEITQLVEIGPRFVLTPIRIFAGSFGGPTLYTNGNYVSPNSIRAELKEQQGNKFAARKEAKEFRKEKEEVLTIPKDPLADTFAD